MLCLMSDVIVNLDHFYSIRLNINLQDIREMKCTAIQLKLGLRIARPTQQTKAF